MSLFLIWRVSTYRRFDCIRTFFIRMLSLIPKLHPSVFFFFLRSTSTFKSTPVDLNVVVHFLREKELLDVKCVHCITICNFPLKYYTIELRARFFIHHSGIRMVGTECIRSILFILPLGAEWMEWHSVHSGIGMRNRKTRAFYILAILIPELWIKKRALRTS